MSVDEDPANHPHYPLVWSLKQFANVLAADA